VIELVKAGIDVVSCRAHLQLHCAALLPKFDACVADAAAEE
jgi:hypothetical protein